MKNIVFVFILFTLNVNSQFAVIKDKDGFTNVRSQQNKKSEIIYKLSENEVFSFNNSIVKPGVDSDWVEIYIPKNKFQIHCNEIDNHLIGYIHKSRLQPIDDLPKYKAGDFTFRYNLQKFYAGNKFIEKEEGWVRKINGRRYFGSDGGLPKTEIAGIEVTLNGQKIEISSVLYEDLFECNNDVTIIENNNNFIISHWNSDGAGGFLIVWVINANGVQQRSIWTP